MNSSLIRESNSPTIKLYTQLSLKDEGKYVEYPEDALEEHIIYYAENAFKLEHDQERVVILITKTNASTFIPKGKPLNSLPKAKNMKILIQPKFISTTIVTAKTEFDMVIDITAKISQIIAPFFEGNIFILRDYYTLFALEDKDHPRPLDPRKPLYYTTLQFNRLILHRYLYIFPPHLMNEYEPACMMFHDCRQYIFDNKDLDIDTSTIILLAVYDAYALNEESLHDGTFDLSKHIPSRFHFSFMSNNEILEVAKTIKNTDKLSIVQNYVNLARKIHNFGVTKYEIPSSHKFATIDPYGITLYDENGEKVTQKILFPNITEIKIDITVLHLKFYNRDTRQIDTISYDLGDMCNSFYMHLLTSIEVLNREIKVSKERMGKSSGPVETEEDIKKRYKIDFKKLLRKLEMSNSIAYKDTNLGESYENIASFYSVKCEVTEGMKHLIRMKNKLTNKNAEELEDIKVIKDKLVEVNNIFLQTREQMRNAYLNKENHLSAYNECAEKAINGVETVKNRWNHISTRGLPDERLNFAERLLELLMFYWCEANFLDILHSKLSSSEKKKVKFNPSDVKKAIIDQQMVIAINKQQDEESLGKERMRMPPRLSEAIIIE